MINNPNLLDRMVDDKLNALRAEGMRSQMLSQAGLPNHKTLLLPDLRQFFHRMLAQVTSYSLRWTEQPGIPKIQVQEDARIYADDCH